MAFTSAKMGLRIWNLITDLYDHAQLADNWAKLDYHDHSPGRGVLIPGEGIADEAIGPNHLQAGVLSGLDPSGAYTGAKSIVRMGGSFPGLNPAGTYTLNDSFALTPTAVPSAVNSSVVYIDPDYWADPNHTVRYALRGSVITNAVAPTATYAFALFPVLTWGGASGLAPTVASLDAVVPSSTTPDIVAPSAGGPSTTSVEFDAPAAGWYVLAVIQTGASVANSNIFLTSTLSAKQI